MMPRIRITWGHTDYLTVFHTVV